MKRLLVVKNEEKANDVVRLASNYGLMAYYKIGIYLGAKKQHEVFVNGNRYNFYKFIKNLDPYIEDILVF